MTTNEALPATKDSPARARSIIRSEVEDCDEEAVAAAELMISEVVTNAVVHGESPIRIDLHHRDAGGAVTVAVTDGGNGRPAPRNPRKDEPRHRGLLIVRSLADDWGVAEYEAGKSVWFTLPCLGYRGFHTGS